MRLYKCYGDCNEKYPLEEMKKIGQKNHCLKCYEKTMKTKKEREELYEYIKYAYKINYPTTYMMKQIKEFTEVRNYKLKGIQLTLKYVVEVLNYTLKPNWGLGIVASQYENAKSYYMELSRKREQHKDVVVKEEIIVISKISQIKTYKNEKLINLEDLV